MLKYQETKTYSSGFYDSQNGDRMYSATDLRKPYDTIYSDGILPTSDGTSGDVLKVSKVSDSDMVIKVGIGNAKLGGAWFTNDAEYVIELDDSKSTDRYDMVIIRNDDTENVRDAFIEVRSMNEAPTAEALTRDGGIYEVCLAYIYVPARATEILAENIVDTRDRPAFCGLMSGVGATVVQTIRNTYFSETENQKVIPIGITQYNNENGRDRLTVIVEGRIFAEGIDYDITDSDSITLKVGLPVVGTKIEFEVLKNVNANGAETVIQEVEALIGEVNSLKKVVEHHYYCNGVDDNEKISAIAQNFVNGGTDYGSMRLVVHGHFGAYRAYSGDGTTVRNYFWFALGKSGATSNRKLVVDFTDCSVINLPIMEGTYNTVFAGNDVHIVGASVIANQSGADTYIRMFASANGVVVAEDCRFWITATLTSYISQTGTFVRCRGSVTVSGAAGYCFYPTNEALLRVQGGEYYAYSSTGFTSAVVYQTHASAVAILYGVNCPTSAISGFVQSFAANCSGKNISITDTITTLPISVPNGNIRGTLAISKAGLM
jgi:hypothetical protein